jgi:hypothetical protein
MRSQLQVEQRKKWRRSLNEKMAKTVSGFLHLPDKLRKGECRLVVAADSGMIVFAQGDLIGVLG